MDSQKRIYQLKNGRKVSLIASYQDYFSDEKFLVLREGERTYIAKALEFSANIVPAEKVVRRTVAEKIALYRSYFRGNDAMVATSFKNSAGKRVYYVWCQRRKISPCPKIKNTKFQCSVCNMQNFQQLDDRVVFDHLRGVNDQKKEAFYGIYPITSDNTVYFLSFDFDKKDWKTEVLALVESAERFGLQPLLELSQSGNGCHVWFFFEKAILAKKVRYFGNLLLRHSMLQNPSISFASFDRMFPSQDEISVSGFGNLIALPLQGSKVQKGCSRFVDKKFKIITDIWGTLEATPKVSDKEMHEVSQLIERELPVHYYKAKEKIEAEFSLFEESQIIPTFTDSIRVVVTNELIIRRADIPKMAAVQLKFLATFHNQAFYNAQRKRRSTYGIPRIISLAEVDQDTIRLPRGLQNKVTELFPNAEYVYQYSQGKELQVKFNGQLQDEQVAALRNLSRNNMGILCAGTGFGKTVVAAKLIADKKVNTLILVHNKNLATQWCSQLERFLIIDDQPFEEYTEKGRKRKKNKIGKVYGSQELRSGLVDIALFQSITKRKKLEELLSQYGMIIVDEAHHVAAKTFEDVIKLADNHYLYGLTATPKREDHLENILYMRLGTIAFTAEKRIPIHIDQQLFLRFTALGEQKSDVNQQTLHDNYESILASEQRNQQIITDICDNLNEKRHIIVLSRYVKHLDVLKQQLEQTEIEAAIYILNSKMKNKELRDELTALKQEGKPFVLLTTGSYAGEGFDLPALDTLMLVMPISGKGNLQQYLGRLLRNLDEKNDLKVYDYVDYAIPMIYRMYQKRLTTYKQLGYRLCEDGSTELSKSSLFTENYQKIFDKDIAVAKEVVLTLPYLDKNVFTRLNGANYQKTIVLVLPTISTVKENSRQTYQLRVQKLAERGYVIRFKDRLSQYFAILDKKMIWMLPNSLENTVALRIFSDDMARRLIHYIDNVR